MEEIDLTMVLDTSEINERKEEPETVSPRLFICYGRTITEYELHGLQTIGRAAADSDADIVIANRFVSRKHGHFNTFNGFTTYTADETTNGMEFKGALLKPGETIVLHDGDELFIPSVGEDENDSIMLVYVNSPARLNVWQELKQSSRDRLTGMYNRGTFTLWWESHHMKSDYEHGYLFILDIDHFRHINDSFGHNIGDKAIQMIADLITRAVRYEHQVCRWGGDEFVGIIPGSPDRVVFRLSALQKAIEETGKQLNIPLTASIGYVDIDEASSRINIEELVDLADRALYLAKQKGPQNLQIYEPIR